MRKTIALVIVHFGPWPKWMGLFLKTCGTNPSIQFFIFSDSEATGSYPENVKFLRYSIGKFSSDASERTGLSINLKDPYKLCDFKPAYGLIFQKYVKGFEFWGHCDMDVIFGNIRNFITDEILENFDVISTKSAYLAGHFTLYRNNKQCRNIFAQSRDWIRVFTRRKNYCFDECDYLWFYLLEGGGIFDFTPNVESMTHVVRRLENNGSLRVFLRDLVIERDSVDELGHFLPWEGNLVWNNGILWDSDSGSECMYFHFHLLKKQPSFKKALSSSFGEKFIINGMGMFNCQ